MNKTLLAVAVTAAAIGTQANALEVYNNEGTVMNIGGHVTVGLTSKAVNKGQQETAKVEEKSPRINFEVIQDLGNGFKADFKGEWQMNMLEGAENTFSTRLGYIGLGHEQYGRVALGTQWSPYYMAAGVVDTPIAWSNGFLYDNHGFFGTARAEKMAAYSNTFDFEGAGALTVGAGWQGYNTATIGGTKFESESRGQAAIGYSISGFNFNYAYNGGDIKDTAANGQTKRAESHLVSGKYGNFGAGLYLAATYGENKNMNARSINSKELMAESEVLDSIAAYGFDNGLNLILKHEEVKDKELNQRADSKSSVQAEYTISPRLRAYTGYQYDHKGTGAYKDGAKDHKWIIGTRFYL